MVFSERTRQAINDQVTNEMQSSYAYLAMGDYCESVGLEGFAKWLRNQSDEEQGHAEKFRTYILDRGERIHHETLNAPTAEFDSIEQVFEAALENEQSVTRAINDLYGLAEQEKDFATQAFLDWFVLEQVEEERTVTAILDWIKRIGSTEQGLFLLDEKLGGGLESATAASGGDAGA
ncbi:MAG: ferritin [Actinomycetota bacterium]